MFNAYYQKFAAQLRREHLRRFLALLVLLSAIYVYWPSDVGYWYSIAWTKVWITQGYGGGGGGGF
jgi:hypothetical protein